MDLNKLPLCLCCFAKHRRWRKKFEVPRRISFDKQNKKKKGKKKNKNVEWGVNRWEFLTRSNANSDTSHIAIDFDIEHHH